MPAHQHPMREILVGWLLVLIASLLTGYLEEHGLLAGSSRALLDSLPRSVASTPSLKVAIVTINDEDYEARFEKKSPLKQEVVLSILEAIRSFGPKIVGVDLDTEEWRNAAEAARMEHVVWARLFTPDTSAPLKIARLGQVLGSDGAGVCFGLTAMQADPDFVIRQYPKEYPGPGERLYFSFPRVIQTLVNKHECETSEAQGAAVEERTEEHWEEGRLLIRYAGPGHEISQVTAGALLDTAELRRTAPPDHPAVKRLSELLGDKVVLLGGSYAAGRDKYNTPVGVLTGVEILAHAIQTELTAPVKEFGSRLKWIDMAFGFCLVIVSVMMQPRWLANLLTLVVVPLLLIWASSELFRSLFFFFDAVPVLAGVGLHSLLEHKLGHRIDHWWARISSRSSHSKTA